MNIKLKNIISKYNQFEWSRLHDDIKSVLNCSDKEAKEKALTACNMVSFWAGIKVQGYTDIEYADFFTQMLNQGFCEENGNITETKDKIIKRLFNADFGILYFEDFEDVINPFRLNKDSLYQMKIINSMHFIICSVENNLMLIYDSGKRGIGVPAVGANRINEKYFKWLMEIEKIWIHSLNFIMHSETAKDRNFFAFFYL